MKCQALLSNHIFGKNKKKMSYADFFIKPVMWKTNGFVIDKYIYSNHV